MHKLSVRPEPVNKPLTRLEHIGPAVQSVLLDIVVAGIRNGHLDPARLIGLLNRVPGGAQCR